MSSIVVHQALHGYSDGHRLLSSSLPLDAPTARVMLVMSDLSGPGVKPSSNGYLTGYPLEKSGKYVFARTWAAPEMPRPGCVWTHSFIIENADLARLTSVQTLLESFVRPDSFNITLPYSTPLQVSPQAQLIEIKKADRVEFMLQALYAFPTRQVVVEVGNPCEDEQIATAIWMQQWPRLRRSFGFCTLSGIERSGKGSYLDLQFVGERDRQIRSKFPKAMIADQAISSNALWHLIIDLAEPASSTLRQFLKRTGGDVEGGRRAMLPLCELYVSLLQAHPPDLAAAVSALATLDSDGRRQARSIRTLVAKHAMRSTGQIDDIVFNFLLKTIEESSDPLAQVEIGDKLGVELWRRSPLRFHSAIASAGILRDVTLHALEKMHPEQIVLGLQKNGGIANDIAELRPDILTQVGFWRIPEIDDRLAENISDMDVCSVAQALLAAGRVGPAEKIIQRADAKDLILAIESAGADSNTVVAWLNVLSRDLKRTAKVLATGQVKKISTIVTIARLIRPDDIPNGSGEDPWFSALQSVSGSIESSDEDYLTAFILNRALGWVSRSQAELLRYSFTKAHNAFEQRRFSREIETLAEWRLGWSNWFEVDRCSRLRAAVTEKFVEYNLEPEIFGRLTNDGPLAIALIDEAARTGRGRKYLERVHEALKSADEKALKVRADYIAQKLK